MTRPHSQVKTRAPGYSLEGRVSNSKRAGRPHRSQTTGSDMGLPLRQTGRPTERSNNPVIRLDRTGTANIHLGFAKYNIALVFRHFHAGHVELHSAAGPTHSAAHHCHVAAARAHAGLPLRLSGLVGHRIVGSLGRAAAHHAGGDSVAGRLGLLASAAHHCRCRGCSKQQRKCARRNDKMPNDDLHILMSAL
jgi:hypothetical protein